MESQNAMGEILAKCMRDETFKNRFVSDPKTVLKEFGVETPEDLSIEVIQDDRNTSHIVLPLAHPEETPLGEDELSAVAAAAGAALMPAGPCVGYWSWRPHD